MKRPVRAVLEKLHQLRVSWKYMDFDVKRRVKVSVSVAIIGLLALGYRQVFDGREDPYYISSRFLQHVREHTCSEESGYDVDEASWTAACNALVADLVPGTELSAPSVRQRNNSTDEEVIVMSNYQSVNGVSAGLELSFDLNRPEFATSAALTGIRSTAIATVGSVHMGSYRASDQRDEPAGRALIQRVQGLLADGRCEEIKAHAPPKKAFPGATSYDGCDAVVNLSSLGAASSTDEVWESFVYAPSELTLPETSEVYGIRRRDGEDQWDFAFRVIDAVEDTNRQLKLKTTNPDVTISAILYEGQWYLESVSVRATNVLYP